MVPFKVLRNAMDMVMGGGGGEGAIFFKQI